MNTRDYIADKITNYNGNSLVIGVLPDGEELIITYEGEDLNEGEVKDYTTGMILTVKNFKEFKNFSEKFVYSRTKNHHIKANGTYIHGGQNIKRWELSNK